MNNFFVQTAILLSSFLINSYAVDEGLGSNFIEDIFVDKSGFLWVGTAGGGLSRIDGHNVITFNTGTESALKSNFVLKVCEDEYGRLWIASENGLDVLDLRTLTPSRVMEQLRDVVPVDERCHYLCSDAEGNVWLSYDNSICKLSFSAVGGGRIKDAKSIRHDGLNPAFNVLKDVNRDGTVWTCIDGRLANIRENVKGELGIQYIYEGINLGPGCFVSDIARYNGDIWITSSLGLVRIDPLNGEHRRYFHVPSDPRSISQNFLTSISVLGSERLVVASLKGYNIYNPISDDFERVGDEFINCTAVYRDLFLLGTETNGLKVMAPRDIPMKNIPSTNGAPVNVVSGDGSGGLYMGLVENGLCHYRGGKKLVHYTMENSGLGHNSVCALCLAPDGVLWCGTWGGGLYCMENGRFKPVRHEAINGYIGLLQYDHINNLIWVGTNETLICYDCAGGGFFYPSDTLPLGSIGSCIDDEGFLWAGGIDGLFIYDLKTKNDGRFNCVHYLNKLDRPSMDVREKITCISKDADGDIWVGSNGGGLYRAFHTDEGSRLFMNYNSENSGLSNNSVKGICADASGRIWISTDYGLNVLEKKSNFLRQIHVRDGLANERFYWNSYYADGNGDLYFGHTNGVTIVRSDDYAPKSTSGNMRLSGVSYSGTCNYDPHLSSLTMHERDRDLKIAFSFEDVYSSRLLQCSYVLNGYDDQKHTLPSGCYEVQYTSLPAGKYTLVISGVDYSGEIVQRLSLDIDVKPYFYKSWIFRILSIVFLALAGYGVLNYRTRYLRRQREELRREVEERTAEIVSQQKLIEQKAEELDRQNRILARQNEELAAHRVVVSSEFQQQQPGSADTKFMDRVMKVLKANYKNPQLDVSTFCVAMGMSKTLLNKKLNEKVGQSIAEFIRSYRLAIAHEMIRNNADTKIKNVSDVAYEVGFNDPKYFTRCFTRAYGVSPSSISKQ